MRQYKDWSRMNSHKKISKNLAKNNFNYIKLFSLINKLVFVIDKTSLLKKNFIIQLFNSVIIITKTFK